MFLLYRIQGERRYASHSLPPHRRKAWAFHIITEGTCSLVVQNGTGTKEKRIKGPVLAIAGPDCTHTWSGRPNDVCNVTILHFDQADPLLCSVVGQKGHVVVPISESELATIQALYNRCGEVRRTTGFSSPKVHESYKVNIMAPKEAIPVPIPFEVGKKAEFFAPLVYGIVCRELTLILLKHLPHTKLGTSPNFGENKVGEAVAWHEAHLSDGPNIQEVAEAVHLSPAHLRRLFHKVRGMSPREAFTRVQFEHAKWLMRDLSMSLESVAESSGFGSASAFSKTFKKEFGVSPKQYRSILGRA